MKKVFLFVLVSVFVCTGVSSFSQEAAAAPAGAAPAAKEAAPKAGDSKVTLESLEGLSEEQILALLKQMSIDDILYLLNQVLNHGSRGLLVNFLGALNQYLASLDTDKAIEFAQRATAENPELGFGMSQDGKPSLFLTGGLDDVNSNPNKPTEDAGSKTVSGGGERN